MHPISAVLFDFAGTLLVPEPAQDWVSAVLPALTHVEARELAARLDVAGRPGGPEPEQLPQRWAEDYALRDVSATRHRRVYEGLLGEVTDPATARRLYDRSTSPAGWVAYPDARTMLTELHARGVRAAVVSNVGFDLRAVFAGHGLDSMVSSYVLSCELGVMKPDLRLFRVACDSLGVTPADCLMVGDNPRADSAAVDIGVRTLLLPYSAPGGVHGLEAVLRLVEGGTR